MGCSLSWALVWPYCIVPSAQLISGLIMFQKQVCVNNAHRQELTGKL
uniref:Uncharacterized protein n=1 Tax=Anguilla anguilla TaxID=7936 RepID=A0A0E9U828_ANGAN